MITPFGRGLETWYLDAGLVDVLEAWADLRRRFRVDAERTSIAGYSMGGYMTYRLGLLMPDRFARASVHVGPPAFFLWPFPNPVVTTPRWRVAGDTNRIVENGLNLPYEIVHGDRDQTVPVAGVQEQADSFARAGNPYRFFRHETDDHLAFAAGDDWSRTQEWLGDHRRSRSPVEVVYRRFPRMDLPRRGLVFDGAYWVDGIDLRDADEETDSGLVRATTLALGGRRRVARLEPQRTVTGPYSPAVLTEQLRVPGDAIQRRNGFEATLRNVAAVTFKVRSMGIDASRRVSASIDTDGPSRVVFAGELSLGRARLDERRAPLILGRRKRIAVDLTSGLHRLELLPP